MAISRNVKPGLALLPLLLLLSALFPAALAEEDRVVLRDGSEYSGQVLSYDGQRLVIEQTGRGRRSIVRADLAQVIFGEQAPPVTVRVKVFSADDEVRLFVNDKEVASADELRRGWVDLGPWLHNGANEIHAAVTNRTNVWAYRWVIEAGGERTSFSCGIPRRSGCARDGRDPSAIGEMSAGRAWIYLRDGDVAVEVEEE